LPESSHTRPPKHDGECFDELVAREGDFDMLASRGWQTLARRFRSASADLSVPRMLDVGCGTGHSRQVYAGRVQSYVGVDLSLMSLRTAATRQRDAAFLQADGARLPFASASFDLVAFSSVLHHMSDMRPALEEAHRVLKPGGVLFAFDPNLRHPAMLMFRHRQSPFYRSEGVSPHEQPLLPGTIRQAVAAAGFAGIGQICQSDIPFKSVGPKDLNRLLAVYNFCDRLWQLSGAGRWLGSFVVTWARRPGA
jgi:SAM-dependent methyltransferase